MRKLASIRRIGEVRAIEGADAIEAVQIDGWQGNQEKLAGHALYVFDVWIIDEQRYATQAERLDIVSHLGLNHAPILHYKAIAPATVADALALADGPSLNAAVKREGLVFKSLCGSQSWKAISNKWLLKHE